MPGGRHDGASTRACDLVEQYLARLYIGKDRRARMPGQHIARQHHHQLIAPQDPAVRVDDSDAVSVAVEGNAEIAALARHRLLQLNQILRDRRIGMMGWKSTVDRLVQQDVPAAQSRGELLHDVSGCAVSGVPGDGQLAITAIVARQPRDILVADCALFSPSSRPLRRLEPARGVAEALDRGPVKRLALENELEAVVVGRVV